MLVLINKYLFSGSFNYPWLLLGFQSAFVSVTISTYYFMYLREWPLRWSHLGELLAPSLAFALFLFSNARALRHLSLPMYSVIKSLAPIAIALLETVMFSERVSRGTYLALVLTIVGNAASVANDLEYSLIGYAWACFNCCVNVLHVLLLRKAVRTPCSNSVKTLASNIWITAISLVVGVYAGEAPGFTKQISSAGLNFILLYGVSCVLSACIGHSVFWVMQTTSGSTLSFVGTSNKAAVILLGAVFFQTKLNAAGALGVTLSVIASICFSVSKARTHAKAPVHLGGHTKFSQHSPSGDAASSPSKHRGDQRGPARPATAQPDGKRPLNRSGGARALVAQPQPDSRLSLIRSSSRMRLWLQRQITKS